MKKKKLLEKLRRSPANVSFDDFVTCIKQFGFVARRVSGSHHIFEREGVQEQVNAQDRKGKAKPYQVRQFLQLMEAYDIEREEMDADA